MITLNTNNFGGAAATLKDYQSADICVLSGKITVDPTNPAYIAAQRLELDLPSGFLMQRSAMSSAILYSSYPIYHSGTVVRCWIENGKICIEKLTPWDTYGNYEIYINSMFVTRGYRGDFQTTECTNIQILNTDDLFQFKCKWCVVKEHFVYFVATFDKFPYVMDGLGPYLC